MSTEEMETCRAWKAGALDRAHYLTSFSTAAGAAQSTQAIYLGYWGSDEFVLGFTKPSVSPGQRAVIDIRIVSKFQRVSISLDELDPQGAAE